jgi:flavin-dependent thymidylate synthase
MSSNSVELIGYYGGDEIHSLSAWTSTKRELTDEKLGRIGVLLKMLATNGHHCYDRETQILTKNGWKYFRDITTTDEVAAVNITDGTVQFEVPEKIHCDDYNDQMYYVAGQQVDLCVTKGHRMVVSQKRCPKEGFGKYEFQLSQHVYGKTRKYLKAAQNQNITRLSTNYGRLIGFFVGDGSIDSRHTISFHLNKKRKINYLSSLDLEVRKLSHNKYSITQKDLGLWFQENCYDKFGNKKLPDEYLEYSQEDFNAIIDGLKNSDGSVKRNTFVYSTTSSLLKDQLLAFAAINNHSFGVYTTYHDNNNWSTLYRLNFSDRISPEVAISQKNRGNTYRDSWQGYNNKVYCVTVSTGAVIVKRNDKVVVSGNTPFEKSMLHFLVKCDTASHIHLIKHRIGVSINAESARYKELKEDQFYIPNDWSDQEKKFYENVCLESYRHYHATLKRLIDAGFDKKRAKESARFYLPYGNQLLMDVSFNFRSFMHFQGLRNSEHAQLEIRDIAREMLDLVRDIGVFNLSLDAFGY